MANVSKHSPFFIFYIQFLFLRCLLASYIKIPDAMAAFKDSTLPSMGIRIRVSACPVRASVRPFPSFPIKNAVPPS